MASDDFDDDYVWRRELVGKMIRKFRKSMERLESDPHYVEKLAEETYHRMLSEEVERLIRSVNREADEEPSNPALEGLRRATWEFLKLYEQSRGS